MKKSLLTFLVSLSCVCAMCAVGCGEDKPNSSTPTDSSVSASLSDTSSSSEENNSSSEIDDSSSDDSSSGGDEEWVEGEQVDLSTLNVSLQEGEGFAYKDAIALRAADGRIILGFHIELGAFYSDSVPVVYVDDVVVAPSSDADVANVFAAEVKQNSVVRVENVKKDVSRMDGTGAFSDAFVVRKPIDLLYIAEQVNKGVPRYVQGAYVLANDIDCQGEELKVIGDLSTPQSYFSGCFSCQANAETGEYERYTISNFTINSNGANYVGLFGAVQADSSVQSSGLFYGIKLDNFTIEANLYEITGSTKTLAVGSLIGFGAGANTFLCDATNGTINLSADINYFSYAGGLVGYQQAYLSNMGQYFPSEITYSVVDVDINVLDGMALCAGGIVGYTYTNYPLVAVPSIHNSYALGDIYGALRVGGIAGGLGQYSVVSNCYAANELTAVCYQTNDGLTTVDYLYAKAGGLVGYAENDTIVHDSFFNGTVFATSAAGDSYASTDPIVGGGDDKGFVSPVSEKYVVLDCLSDIDLSTLNSEGGILHTELGWGNYDWTFSKNNLPKINYENYTENITKDLTLEYVTKNAEGVWENVTVDGLAQYPRKFFDASSDSSSSYVTLGNFFVTGSLQTYYTADNGFCSFGYYFDKECTIPVPYAYMPAKDVTLYVGFYDLSTIESTYYFQASNGEWITLHLGADGYATYTDGASDQKIAYTYNGDRFVLESARLTRYFDGPINPEVDEYTYYDGKFDLYRYTFYNLIGSIDEGELTLYDGAYFTKDAPLVATTTKPSMEEYDIFKGEWTKSANIQKTFTFDGKGEWTYADGATELKGTYTVTESKALFTMNDVVHHATFNDDGVLEIISHENARTPMLFTRKMSYTGTWTGTNSYYGDFTLELGGIKANGLGKAVLSYANGVSYDIVYEASTQAGYAVLFLSDETAEKGDILGYFTYNATMHQLNAVLYDPSTTSYYKAFNLQAIDDYEGEWICNAEDLLHVEFTFNGVGLYDAGKLTINDNGVLTEISYNLDRTLRGAFTYKGVEYEISYNEDEQSVTISYADKESLLERKDEFAGITFVDKEGTRYLFDGRSNLSSGGKLTVGDTVYNYYKHSDGYSVDNGVTSWGVIVRDGNHYKLTKGPSASGEIIELYIENEFMGEWAMRGEFDTFKVGYTDLDGNIHATFRGFDVVMRYYQLSNYGTPSYTFSFKDGKMPYTYYLFIIPEESVNEKYLVLTEYADLTGDDYIYCSRVDESLFNAWTSNRMSNMTLEFDGVSQSYATLYTGVARQSMNGYSTMYYYYFAEGRLIMYSQSSLGGKILRYDVKILHEGDEGYEEAKTNRNNWFDAKTGTVLVQTEVDSLYGGVATDEDENEYFFDFVIEGNEVLGGIRMNGELKYTYNSSAVSFNSATSEALIEATDVTTGKKYLLTLDYSNAEGKGDILIIGDEITA